MGSRSLQQGGAAVQQASIELVAKAKDLAAKLLEADVDDVVLDKDAGAFHVAGTPAVARTWADLAVAAKQEGTGLGVDTVFEAGGATFPFGAHVAVVEVDTDTGQVRHLRHIALDDAGRVLNPLLLEGQIHGGIAQGAAQALLEEFRYDDDGNPVTGNFADYAFPSAAELPSFELIHMETPTPINPLGAKGIGESGTIGSTPAVQSAVCDALAPPRRAPRRHADDRRAGVAGHPGGPERDQLSASNSSTRPVARWGKIRAVQPQTNGHIGGDPLRIKVTVNGTEHDDEVEPRLAARALHPRDARSHRHERRLRHVVVRRVHACTSTASR